MADWQVVLLILGLLLGAAIVQRLNAPPAMLCATCGALERPRSKSTASVGVGLAMWVGGLAAAWLVHWIFILAPIGHLIAVSAQSRVPVCPKCGGTQLLPPDSPMARKLRRDLEL